MAYPDARFLDGSPDLDEGVIFLAGDNEASTLLDACYAARSRAAGPPSAEMETVTYELVPVEHTAALRRLVAAELAVRDSLDVFDSTHGGAEERLAQFGVASDELDAALAELPKEWRP